MATKQIVERVMVKPPNFQSAIVGIEGTDPLVVNRVSQKAKTLVHDQHERGSEARTKKVREKKDFQECYRQSLYISEEGWYGIPAAAFRAALIRACSIVGIVMTQAKMSIFVKADGFDKVDKTPLVKITKGKPHYVEHWVHVGNNVPDLRARGMFDPGWKAEVHLEWDGDQFRKEDMVNLMMRVGLQVGLLEGRNASRMSCGMGWGNFKLDGAE